jgi:hypothetical protein
MQRSPIEMAMVISMTLFLLLCCGIESLLSRFRFGIQFIAIVIEYISNYQGWNLTDSMMDVSLFFSFIPSPFDPPF